MASRQNPEIVSISFLLVFYPVRKLFEHLDCLDYAVVLNCLLLCFAVCALSGNIAEI